MNVSCGFILLPTCRQAATSLRRCLCSFLGRGGCSVHYIRSLFNQAELFHITCAFTIVIASGKLKYFMALCFDNGRRITVCMSLTLSVVHTGAHLVNAVNCSRHYNHKWVDINIADSPEQNPIQLILSTGNLLNVPIFDEKCCYILVVLKFESNHSAIVLFIVPGITGVLMMVILVMMVVTSGRWFRTRHFNTFYYSHHFLFGPFLTLLILHPTR